MTLREDAGNPGMYDKTKRDKLAVRACANGGEREEGFEIRYLTVV
jgi:hypothetical protein